MTPYPGLEMDALTDLANAARLLATGGAVDKGQAAHAAWCVVGYGLSLGLPDASPPVFGAKPSSAELTDFAAQLDRARDCGCDTGKMQALNINWASLIKIALTILGLLAGGA